MKVITQLVRHFWMRGVLTKEDAEYLLEHGFARERDLPGHVVEEVEPWSLLDSDVELQAPEHLEAIEAELRQKSPGARGKTSSKAITEKQLRQRVNREFARRKKSLEAVLRLAQSIEKCSAVHEGLTILRRLSQQQFQQACVDMLKTQPDLLGELWTGLDLEPFFGLVARSECLGRVAQSYFALLVVDDPARLGKYGWLLQYDELQMLLNLKHAHARLLRVVGYLYRRQTRCLTKALAAGVQPTLFWALLLVHNARRGECSVLDPVREYGPVPSPDESLWRQAWVEAAGIDHKALTPYLISCFSKHGSKIDSADGGWAQALYCPVGWHVPASNAT